MRIEKLKKFRGRNPRGYFENLPWEAKQRAQLLLSRFCERWRGNLPRWRFAILVGQAKRLALMSANVVNTALVQYARRHYNFPGATGQPDLSVVNDLELGHNFGTYDAIYESRVEGADSVSWVKGNHVWKFGFDGNYVWSANNYPGFTPERILLPNLGCLDAFANFVQFGNPNSTAAGALGGAVGCPLPETLAATATPTNCAITPSGCGADGVAFLYLGVALPRTGFANGYVPLPFGPWPIFRQSGQPVRAGNDCCRPSRLQQRRCQCRLPWRDDYRDKSGQVLQHDRKLHLFTYNRQWEFHYVHQPAPEPV